MNTQAKKRKSVRVEGPKRPAARVARASTRRQVTGPDTSPGAITEGVQAADKGDVLLYQGKGGIALEVRVQGDTVWLTQPQMAKLFGCERSVVTKHVNNVFAEGELDRKSNVQNMHTASSDKPVALYSLDTIISVGYRVKSKQGTRFRIWATQTLREHLLRGYTLNEKRLRERGFTEVEQAIELLSSTLKNQSLITDQGRAVLDIVQQYTRAWRLLLEYDEDRLPSSPTHPLTWNSPLRLLAGEIKFRPLRAAKLSGMYEDKRGQRAFQIIGSDVVRTAGLGCVAKNPYERRTHSMSRVAGAARFDLFQNGKDLSRRDLSDRSAAQRSAKANRSN